VPVLIIASNIRLGINEIKLYEYGIDKYQINRVTNIDKPELIKVHRHLIGYYNSKVDSAQVTVTKSGWGFNIFSEKELVHLKDVKGLVQLDYIVQIATLVLIFVCGLVLLLWLKEGWYTLVKGFLWGGVTTIGLMIFLAIWAVLGFEQLFILFHRLSFTNEFWILDPSKDYLLMLFPEGFFYDTAMFGFVAVIIEALVIGSVAYTVLRLKGRSRL
jgi:integral membrane protein (TIGR01906 family)